MAQRKEMVHIFSSLPFAAHISHKLHFGSEGNTNDIFRGPTINDAQPAKCLLKKMALGTKYPSCADGVFNYVFSQFWLSLRRLVSWINHLSPACWSTFWKSTFKQQLGCRFDRMDCKSFFYFYLVFWHMQSYMSCYIICFSALALLLKSVLYFYRVLMY